jgi:hypothetical protein
MAVLSKGPVGLFPLTIVFIYWLLFPNLSLKKALGFFAIIFFSAVALLVLLFLIEPEALNNISRYINSQLMPSIKNERDAGDNHFYILIRLFLELIPSMIVALIAIIISRFHLKKKEKIMTPDVSFFVLIGVTASFPLMITLKQHGYYIVPAIPFYIIGLSIIIAPRIQFLFDKITPRFEKKLKRVSIILFFITLLFSFSFIGKSGGADGILAEITGKHSQDQNILHDVYILSEKIPPGTVLSVPGKLCRELRLWAYLYRIGNLSIDCYAKHEYYLIDNNTRQEDWPFDEYLEIQSVKMTNYKIYERIKH